MSEDWQWLLIMTCSSSRSFSSGFHQVLTVRPKFDSAEQWTGYLPKETNPSVRLLYTPHMNRIDGEAWRSWGSKGKVQKWMMDKENMSQQGKMWEGNESRRTVPLGHLNACGEHIVVIFLWFSCKLLTVPRERWCWKESEVIESLWEYCARSRGGHSSQCC